MCTSCNPVICPIYGVSDDAQCVIPYDVHNKMNSNIFKKNNLDINFESDKKVDNIIKSITENVSEYKIELENSINFEYKQDEYIESEYTTDFEFKVSIDSDTKDDIKIDSKAESKFDSKADTIISNDSKLDTRLEMKLGKNNSDKLDKFYTNVYTVANCINTLSKLYDWDKFDFIVEPSAGSGNFLLQIPSINKIGIDIEPEHNNIIRQDFFTYLPPSDKKNILTIGNPPFGRVSSLAIKFFNHASKFSNVIAFIIPRTFRKINVQNRLNLNFHLIYDEELPVYPCCFTPKMKVKCAFQIWEKRDEAREVITMSIIHSDWDFIHPNNISIADFAIRAYGGVCGTIELKNLNNLNIKGWHFIKSNIPIDDLVNRFKLLDYSSSTNTARQDSLGKGELVSIYTNFMH